MCVFVCLYVYIHISIYVCMYFCMYVSIYLSIYILMHIYEGRYVSMYVCIYGCSMYVDPHTWRFATAWIVKLNIYATTELTKLKLYGRWACRFRTLWIAKSSLRRPTTHTAVTPEACSPVLTHTHKHTHTHTHKQYLHAYIQTYRHICIYIRI